MTLASRLATTVALLTVPLGGAAAAEMVSHEAVYRLTLEDLRIEGWAERSGGTMELRFARDCFHWAVDRHLEFGIRFTDGRRTQIVVTEKIRESINGEQFWFWSRTTLNGGTARIIAGHAVRPQEGQMITVEPPKEEKAENGKAGAGKPGSSGLKVAQAQAAEAAKPPAGKPGADGDKKVEKRLLGVTIDYAWPEDTDVEVPPNVIFPFTALSKQLDSLQSNSLIREQHIFDGTSASGAFRVVYDPIRVASVTSAPVPEGEAELVNARSWRFQIRYVPLEGGQGKPLRTTTSLLHANGVTSQVVMDYGPFSVKGDIISIKSLEPPACE